MKIKKYYIIIVTLLIGFQHHIKGQIKDGNIKTKSSHLITAGVDFTESNLPIIMIDTEGQIIPDEPKITAKMKVLNSPNGINNINDTIYEYNGYIGIEIRGNTAQMFPKKSYTVETRLSTGENNNVSLLGLPMENDWVFHGPYSDKSLMRNVMAYHIGNGMGHWSPRTRFCEVVLNGQYSGIYVLVEKIKRDKTRVNIAKLKPEDISGDQLTGGYIMSIDRDQPGSWNSPFMGRTGSVDVPVSYVDPKYSELTDEQRSYIREYITDFEYALDGENYKDPALGYRAYIDVESFIDYFIITELSRDLDGYRVSVYFHKDKDSKGGKLIMSPFWDYNICFGNANFMQAWLTTGWAEEGIGAGDWYEIPFWWDKLRTDPYFETMLKYRWEKLRNNVLDKARLMNCIDSCKNLLNEAQVRNFTQYNNLGYKVWPNKYALGSYINEVDYLKDWFDKRIDWLDSQIALIEPAFPDGVDKINGNMSVVSYPNPFINRLTLDIDLNSAGTIDVVIYGITGTIVYQKSMVGHSGSNIMVINDGEIKSSENVFFYSVLLNDQIIKTGKVIKR